MATGNINNPLKEFDLLPCLIHPITQLRVFDRAAPRLHHAPLNTWSWLVLIAILGSSIYGASLSFCFTNFRAEGSALWLTVSAGLAWCIFGPLLVKLTKKNMFVCAHACLITMAYGEIVLISGATINAVFWANHAIKPELALIANSLCVGCSNLTMMTMLSAQLKGIGVPFWKTCLLWFLVLNGAGSALFFLLQSLLHRGA